MLAALILAASLASSASARAWPDCLHIGAKHKPPQTLTQLRSCQKSAARRLAARAEAKGRPLSRADRDALGEHQRAEARRFLARPGVVIEGSPTPAQAPEEEPARDEPASAQPDEKDASSSDGQGAIPSAILAAADTIIGRYHAAGVSKVPPGDIADYKSALSDSKGVITPEIEKMIGERISAAAANDDQTQGQSQDSSGDDSR